LESLILPAIRALELYLVNQSDYVKTILPVEVREPELNGKYFWIFRNLDYMCWRQPRTETESYDEHPKGITTLVLSGSPILEYAASHTVRNFPNTDAHGLLLYFFYRSESTRKFNQSLTDATSKDLICTLLKQLIEGHSLHRQEFLTRTFLRKVLERSSEEKITNASTPKDPMESFKRLLCTSSLDILWSALKSALIDASEPCRNVDSEPLAPSMPQNKQHVTFVFDLGDHSVEDVKALIDIVRPVLVGLRRSYRTAKMMVMCNSLAKGIEFGLQRPSEVLVEYDKERQGLYNRELTHLQLTRPE
jgi:hypothetical protein